MNIFLGQSISPTWVVAWTAPDTGIVYQPKDARQAQVAYTARVRAKKAHDAEVARAYADAQAAALRDQYSAEVAAASARGRDDFNFNTWKAESSSGPSSHSPSLASSLLPLVALAAAGLYFWKG